MDGAIPNPLLIPLAELSPDAEEIPDVVDNVETVLAALDPRTSELGPLFGFANGNNEL